MTDVTLETLNAKLDLLLAGQTQAAPLEAYDLPALTPDQVDVADGGTPSRDGSVWATQHGGAFNRGSGVEQGADSTQLVQVRYGYLSPIKNPELWAKMREIGGAQFEAWDAARDPWALYNAYPGAVAFGGDPNWITLQGMLQSYGRFEQ